MLIHILTIVSVEWRHVKSLKNTLIEFPDPENP